MSMKSLCNIPHSTGKVCCSLTSILASLFGWYLIPILIKHTSSLILHSSSKTLTLGIFLLKLLHALVPCPIHYYTLFLKLYMLFHPVMCEQAASCTCSTTIVVDLPSFQLTFWIKHHNKLPSLILSPPLLGLMYATLLQTTYSSISWSFLILTCQITTNISLIF